MPTISAHWAAASVSCSPCISEKEHSNLGSHANLPHDSCQVMEEGAQLRHMLHPQRLLKSFSHAHAAEGPSQTINSLSGQKVDTPKKSHATSLYKQASHNWQLNCAGATSAQGAAVTPFELVFDDMPIEVDSLQAADSDLAIPASLANTMSPAATNAKAYHAKHVSDTASQDLSKSACNVQITNIMALEDRATRSIESNERHDWPLECLPEIYPSHKSAYCAQQSIGTPYLRIDPELQDICNKCTLVFDDGMQGASSKPFPPKLIYGLARSTPAKAANSLTFGSNSDVNDASKTCSSGTASTLPHASQDELHIDSDVQRA